MYRLPALVIALASLAFLAASGHAHDYRLGNLVIDHPHARATAPGAPVGGGYLVIRNTGEAADRLVEVRADFAEQAQIHEMRMEGDVMRMRPLAEGLEIAPGESVELKPGGYHLMFMGLKAPLVEGESRSVTLVFEKAGEIEVEFNVEGKAAGSGQSHRH